MFKTITELKEANKKIGHHFFDKDTMKFFKSKIESSILKGKYLIISNKYDGNTKKFMIIEIFEKGNVNYLTREYFYSKELAKEFLSNYLKNKEV